MHSLRLWNGNASSPSEKLIPLINLLNEMLQDGELSGEERKQVDVLGRAMNIPPGIVAYWEAKILKEIEATKPLPSATAQGETGKSGSCGKTRTSAVAS